MFTKAQCLSSALSQPVFSKAFPLPMPPNLCALSTVSTKTVDSAPLITFSWNMTNHNGTFSCYPTGYFS